MVDANTYEVVVEAEQETVRSEQAGHRVQTVHRVRMSPAYYRKLSGGAFTHEWVIVQAFQFLLEHEANTEILSNFDLSTINRYFPEFEEEMNRRLHRL